MKTSTVGFKKNKEEDAIDRENLLQYITQQDTKSFGLIPELVGRLPVLTYLEPLDKATLKQILVEPKNSLVKQYKKLFSIENIELNIDDETLDFMVEKAMEYKLGARGLRSIFEAIVNDAMFELPSTDIDKFYLTLEYAQEKLNKSKMAKLKVA